MLGAEEGSAANLPTIVVQELHAHGMREGERVRLDGPEISLSVDQAQALALAFHELATNAIKYGAMSQPQGTITIGWNVAARDDRKEIVVTWREMCPVSVPPTRRGFGSEIIEKGVPYILGGDSRLTIHPDGAECIVRFPAEREALH